MHQVLATVIATTQDELSARGAVLALLAPIVVAVAPAAPARAADCATYPWMDTRKSPEQRARALLAASTRQQKYRWLVEQPANSPQQTTWPDGVVYPVQVPCTPTVVYSDGPDGVRFTPGVTAFPATIATAATWNQPLAYVKGAAHAAEAFDKGKNVLLAPGLASGRTPLSGRTPEYLGEDPLLTGQITQAQLDAAASRVVRSYLRGGLFDRPLPAAPVDDASTPAHKAVARATAEQGSVLLKNDKVLPLRPASGDTIAVIGPTASSTPTGGISANSVCSLPWRFGNPQTLRCEDLISPETGIRDRAARDGATVTFDNGSDPAAAAAAAARADVAVVFGYVRMGEFTDLTDLRLQGNGDALISAVAAADPRTVVVLQTGSAVEMPWLSQVPAVLETWYGGEQMGPALAALLFGDANPSGKLPMTFPKSLADTPTAGSPAQYPGVLADGSTIRQVNYTEGLKVGYRWYESERIEPLFPFGHGLSYTSFSYRNLRVSGDGRKDVRIRFTVTNTGRRPGTEVAQAYVTLPATTREPAKRLAGWSRLTLDPGRSRTVELRFDRSDLADLHLLEYWEAGRGDWTTAEGRYEFRVGGSSDTALRDTLHVR